MSELDPIKRVVLHWCSALHSISSFASSFFSLRSFIHSVPLCAIFDSEPILLSVEKAGYSQVAYAEFVMCIKSEYCGCTSDRRLLTLLFKGVAMVLR